MARADLDNVAGGRFARKFCCLSVMLVCDGIMIGANLVRSAYISAGLVAAITICNIIMIVRVYQSDIRLLRVEERLNRRPWTSPEGWPPLPTRPPPPPAPPAMKP
jgi:hypothetical protein